MYPKYFFERFWEGEQKDQLFVGMAFDNQEKNKMDIINKVATISFKDNAFMVGSEVEANSKNHIIFDSIANSKMILFDLSDDKRFPETKNDDFSRINQNVIYELGIASSIREPTDIILIRKKTDTPLKLPFDIQTLNVHLFDGDLTENFLIPIIKKALEKQEWYKSKRVKAAAESIDEFGLGLMLESGTKPDNWDHFSFEDFSLMSMPKRIAAHRLMDLGILFFDTGKCRNPSEYAYHWTSFGREVMKFLCIKRMSKEEFEKSPQYPDAVKVLEEYLKKENKSL